MQKLLKKVSSSIVLILKKHGIAFIVGFTAAVLCYLLIIDISDRYSGPEYCGSCHETKPAYDSWKKSVHYKNPSGVEVDCVDCHLPPREEFFNHITQKSLYACKDLYRHYMQIRTDPNELREQVAAGMPDSRCTNCHDGTLTSEGSTAAKIAHKAALEKGQRCLDCHTSMHNWDALKSDKD
jgi:nitrate/TMAO reductase-like tetraheme cytochrome c subunit